MSQFYRKKSSAVLSFVRGNIFYILLGLTLLAFCLLGGLSFRKDSNPPADDNMVETEDKDPVGSLKPDKNDKPNTEEEKPDTSVDVIPEQTVFYVAPVEGEAAIPFSGTVPVFSETLNEWHMHQGIDYCTTESVAVSAVADGIVEDVYEDDLMGYTVVIKHADGVRSIYQSLDQSVRVRIGQSVFQGNAIGFTGSSAESECADGLHVHFSMIENGIYIDPVSKFKQ